MNTYIHTYIRAYVRTYVHTYIDTYINRYIHTHMHIAWHCHNITHKLLWDISQQLVVLGQLTMSPWNQWSSSEAEVGSGVQWGSPSRFRPWSLFEPRGPSAFYEATLSMGHHLGWMKLEVHHEEEPKHCRNEHSHDRKHRHHPFTILTKGGCQNVGNVMLLGEDTHCCSYPMVNARWMLHFLRGERSIRSPKNTSCEKPLTQSLIFLVSSSFSGNKMNVFWTKMIDDDPDCYVLYIYIFIYCQFGSTPVRTKCSMGTLSSLPNPLRPRSLLPKLVLMPQRSLADLQPLAPWASNPPAEIKCWLEGLWMDLRLDSLCKWRWYWACSHPQQFIFLLVLAQFIFRGFKPFHPVSSCGPVLENLASVMQTVMALAQRFSQKLPFHYLCQRVS